MIWVRSGMWIFALVVTFFPSESSAFGISGVPSGRFSLRRGSTVTPPDIESENNGVQSKESFPFYASQNGASHDDGSLLSNDDVTRATQELLAAESEYRGQFDIETSSFETETEAYDGSEESFGIVGATDETESTTCETTLLQSEEMELIEKPDQASFEAFLEVNGSQGTVSASPEESIGHPAAETNLLEDVNGVTAIESEKADTEGLKSTDAADIVIGTTDEQTDAALAEIHSDICAGSSGENVIEEQPTSFLLEDDLLEEKSMHSLESDVNSSDESHIVSEKANPESANPISVDLSAKPDEKEVAEREEPAKPLPETSDVLSLYTELLTDAVEENGPESSDSFENDVNADVVKVVSDLLSDTEEDREAGENEMQLGKMQPVAEDCSTEAEDILTHSLSEEEATEDQEITLEAQDEGPSVEELLMPKIDALLGEDFECPESSTEADSTESLSSVNNPLSDAVDNEFHTLSSKTVVPDAQAPSPARPRKKLPTMKVPFVSQDTSEVKPDSGSLETQPPGPGDDTRSGSQTRESSPRQKSSTSVAAADVSHRESSSPMGKLNQPGHANMPGQENSEMTPDDFDAEYEELKFTLEKALRKRPSTGRAKAEKVKTELPVESDEETSKKDNVEPSDMWWLEGGVKIDRHVGASPPWFEEADHPLPPPTDEHFDVHDDFPPPPVEEPVLFRRRRVPGPPSKIHVDNPVSTIGAFTPKVKGNMSKKRDLAARFVLPDAHIEPPLNGGVPPGAPYSRPTGSRMPGPVPVHADNPVGTVGAFTPATKGTDVTGSNRAANNDSRKTIPYLGPNTNKSQASKPRGIQPILPRPSPRLQLNADDPFEVTGSVSPAKREEPPKRVTEAPAFPIRPRRRRVPTTKNESSQTQFVSRNGSGPVLVRADDPSSFGKTPSSMSVRKRVPAGTRLMRGTLASKSVASPASRSQPQKPSVEDKLLLLKYKFMVLLLPWCFFGYDHHGSVRLPTTVASKKSSMAATSLSISPTPLRTYLDNPGARKLLTLKYTFMILLIPWWLDSVADEAESPTAQKVHEVPTNELDELDTHEFIESVVNEFEEAATQQCEDAPVEVPKAPAAEQFKTPVGTEPQGTASNGYQKRSSLNRARVVIRDDTNKIIAQEPYGEEDKAPTVNFNASNSPGAAAHMPLVSNGKKKSIVENIVAKSSSSKKKNGQPSAQVQKVLKSVAPAQKKTSPTQAAQTAVNKQSSLNPGLRRNLSNDVRQAPTHADYELRADGKLVAIRP